MSSLTIWKTYLRRSKAWRRNHAIFVDLPLMLSCDPFRHQSRHNLAEAPGRQRRIIRLVIVEDNVGFSGEAGELGGPVGDLTQLLVRVFVVKALSHRSAPDVATRIPAMGPQISESRSSKQVKARHYHEVVADRCVYGRQRDLTLGEIGDRVV